MQDAVDPAPSVPLTAPYDFSRGVRNIPKPGEISLAHRGALFLDEFSEFGTRVQAARNIQQARFTNSEYRTSNNGSSPDIVCKADMRVGEIRQFCKLQDEGQSLIRAAMTQLNLSARAYHRIPWTGRPGQAQTSAHDCGFGGE